jgi:hypothetical protein
MSKIDVGLLQKVLDWAYEQYQRALRGEPSEWNQGTWFIDLTAVSSLDSERTERAIDAGTVCDTACCIGGKTAIMMGWRPVWSSGDLVQHPTENYMASVRHVAAAGLGLSPYEAGLLFNGRNNIRDLYEHASRFTRGKVVVPLDLPERKANPSQPIWVLSA